jgi:hypothetical protein
MAIIHVVCIILCVFFVNVCKAEHIVLLSGNSLNIRESFTLVTSDPPCSICNISWCGTHQLHFRRILVSDFQESC